MTQEIKTSITIMSEAIAKAEKDIEKARIMGLIYESLPVKPARIFVYPLYKSVASVTYEAKTKQEAFNIYAAFSPIPAYICRDSSVSIKPFEDEAAREVSEIYAWVSVDQHEAKLEFFADSPAGIIRIDVVMPVALFGRYVRSDNNAKIHFHMDWTPFPKTLEMFRAVTYAPAYREGVQSGKQTIYALYDCYEVVNQFEGDE